MNHTKRPHSFSRSHRQEAFYSSPTKKVFYLSTSPPCSSNSVWYYTPQHTASVWYYHDVAVIGDSFVNRLRNDRATDRNLDLPHQINVRWYTQGGLTIARMDSTFDCIARDFQQIAILQIGSNDLCQQSSKVFIDNLCTRIIPRLKDLGCKVIVLCQLFHRRPGKYTIGVDLQSYNRRIEEANAAMASLNLHNIIFWEHTSVLRSGSSHKMWNTDGVHLSNEGLPFFRRSIRGAILTTTDSMDRYGFNLKGQWKLPWSLTNYLQIWCNCIYFNYLQINCIYFPPLAPFCLTLALRELLRSSWMCLLIQGYEKFNLWFTGFLQAEGQIYPE